MKAFLLAAGYGTRLRPLTETVPKCLVPVRGRPLLGWWLDLLRRHGVSGVLINTHYLPEQVDAYVDGYCQEYPELAVETVFEPELLGSGGTVSRNRGFVGKDEDFLICYGDVLTDLNLTDMARFHQTHSGVLTMALYHAPHPSQCGIVQMDAEGRIQTFQEKPDKPASDLANAGVYLARRSLLDRLPDTVPLDFGGDVLPKLTGNIYGYLPDCYLLDIGSMERYQRAQEEWPHDYL